MVEVIVYYMTLHQWVKKKEERDRVQSQAEEVTQLVKYLTSMHETLGSIFSTV